MKPSPHRLLVLLAALSSASLAAPLTGPTAVHLKADATSATLTVLKAGSEPSPAASAPTNLPSGWMTVELPGPHEVYVQNRDITKSLDVRPGAELRNAPKSDAPVVSIALAGETLDITGLHGRWTQLRLTRPLVGYIRVAGLPASLPLASIPAAPRSASTVSTPPPAPLSPPPSKPAAYGFSAPGQPVSVVSLGEGGTDALPRTFQGRFISTRNPFRPRRPYDWALSDESGSRFAYLDVSRLLQTEQIENYTNRIVAVFGAAKPMPGTKDFVIVVESLQLK